ncbi:LysE family translocator [Laceyella putida]|uniref:LysE family translocator n=1 Tax=Laceyella putida TaxID=110101 RepID=A0ABW2RN51_9BACL
MELDTLLTFLAYSVSLTLLPGPDILFVLSQSVFQGKKDGLAISLGLCTGLIAHTLAAALGVSMILYHSALAFHVLKIAGVAYLLYLAWQSLKATGEASLQPAEKKQSLGALYKRGILMNLLNPKVSIFFLAFFPQFVEAQAGHVPLQMLTLGFVFIAQALVIFTAVSLIAGKLGERFLQKHLKGKWVNYGTAGIFALLGIRLAFVEK